MAVVVLALMLSGAWLEAGVVQVGAPGGLTGGPFSLEDFEDDTFVPGLSFSASTGTRRLPASNLSGSVVPSGTYGLGTEGFPDPITVAFASPASSVGMWFGNDDTCCSSGFTAYLDISGAGGPIGTISVAANMNDHVDQFIGFNSDEQVTSVTIRYGTGQNVGLYHYIDDVYFNTADVIPEPATLVVFGLGGLAALIRRRRQR